MNYQNVDRLVLIAVVYQPNGSRVRHNPWPDGPRPVKVGAGHVDWSVTGPTNR